MPQDTTVQYYSNGETVTITGPKDSIESYYQRYMQERPEMMKMIEQTVPESKEVSNDNDSGVAAFIFIGIMVVVIYFLQTRLQPKIEKFVNNYLDEPPHQPQATIPSPSALVYHGSELPFSDEELDNVLNKYFVYYLKLGYKDKEKFLHRLKKFISCRTFIIHAESGFKEMPILISASAIQISFGLDKYLLPHFSHINIFPEEFIGYHPTLRILEGNVSGHSINLSWKHFMQGYKLPDNGQNVGLHEFAHAFYYQYFEARENVERDFVETFALFDACGNKAFEMELQHSARLYSDYALRNFQEFWAESIEIFFERPVDMQKKYPDLYESMCDILNQDPLHDKLNLT